MLYLQVYLVFFFSLFVFSTCISEIYFDYIIVGSGSGGSVIANRLSNNSSITVLLLEAGEIPPLITEIPLFPLNIAQTNFSWNFTTVPSKTIAQDLKGRCFRIVAGKGLGGTTNLNYNLFVRGNKRDYDYWAKNGSVGWDWKNVFPYFLDLEDNKDPKFVNNGYHGVGGNLIVQLPPFHSPITEGYLKSAEEIGYGLGDFNARDQAVFQPPQGTENEGRRWGARKAFIDPIRGRTNLWIRTSAFVTKVLIDRKNRAYGVRYEYHGKSLVALCKHEVIVSAGVFNSPKLLLLSGIGPKDTLNKLKIPVKMDLPVGLNLQEQISSPGMFFETNSFSFREDRITELDLFEFLINGTGPLTSLGAVETIGFVNSKYNKDPNWPDIELIWATVSPASDKGQVFRPILNLNDELWKIYEPYLNKDTITCFPYFTRPKSRGMVTIKSDNPHDDPVIDFKFYSDPYDLKVMIEAMRFCLNQASTKAMKKFGVRPVSVTIPGCEKYVKFSDDYLACVAIVYPFPVYHYLGTCKMGACSDPGTVVDPTLKVKGVTGLRVADASIIPFMVTGHTNIPTMMIGNKAAAMILSDLQG